MTTFFLIRHATCSGLGQMLWGRTRDIRLNDEGKLQAQRLADRFAEIPVDAIYSSPLERALQTAETIARSLHLEVTKNSSFDEIDFGEWTGKTFEELSTDKRWRRFNSQRSLTPIPGGESFLEVQNRVVKELDSLSNHHGNARVAIVSHADVIRAAVAYFSATPIDLIERFEISPCSVSAVAVGKETATLLMINNCGDLTQLLPG